MNHTELWKHRLLNRRLWAVMFVCGCLATMVGGVVAQDTTQTRPVETEPTESTRWNDPEYLHWLEERSMLYQAGILARPVSGIGAPWQRRYGEPQPRAVVEDASVWVLGYPGAVIAPTGTSVIAAWAKPELWEVFQELGIDLLHTGPVKRAGGIRGYDHTPTVDGWFDRISLEIDPELGTEQEYRRMVEIAAEHGGQVAGDLVPLHTGLGADFRLAERNYKNYPGMYTMVEVRPEHWGLLPHVEGEWLAAPVSKDAAAKLMENGYIPGIINVADAAPEARNLSGWDATGAIPGADGKVRRWVYLHYFKPGQPTLNWLDPSMAAQRAISGDLVRTIRDLGAKVVRLDAVPFLGIEPRPGQLLAWHYQHPLAVQGTEMLAMMTRKLGGWSFQELNVPLVELKTYNEHGPDLSYDFVTRTQVLHALLVGDAYLLRQAFGFLLESGLQPVQFVHDLQNHDEITYQLVELDYRGDDPFHVDGKEVFGRQLREQVLDQMRRRAGSMPYNKLYRPEEDGVATTFAGFIASALEIDDPYHATPDQVAEIIRGHRLLAHANAMQPGVFSLSSWDLVGALPLHAEQVAGRTDDGDWRWVNRGGVDLLGDNPDATESTWGLPRARALYGPVPQQLDDPESFASGLKRMLAARKEYQIHLGELIAVPEPDHDALCLLVLALPGTPRYAITALNFGREPVTEPIDLHSIDRLPAKQLEGRTVSEAVSGHDEGTISDQGRLTVTLGPWEGKTLILEPR